MRMYVSVLRIDGVWKIYSPDVNSIFSISEDEYKNGNYESIIESIKHSLTSMPDPTYVVIVKTKQWMRENGYSIDSFIKVIPIEFEV